MAINVEVMDGFPIVDFARENPTGQYQVKIGYLDLVPFIAELFPTRLYRGRDYLGSAPMPGFPWLRCERIKVKPYGINFGTGTVPPLYPFWLVDINYSSLRRDGQMGGGPRNDRSGPGGSKGSDNGQGGGQTFLSHSGSVSGEFLALPEVALRWQLDVNGNPVADNNAQAIKTKDNIRAGLVVPTITHKLQWSYVYYPPWAAIRTCLGSVNINPIMGAYAETLLFMGCEFHRDYDTMGQSHWQLGYNFAEKCYNYAQVGGTTTAQGWNHFLRPETGNFERIVRRNAPNTPVYGLQDFGTLFVEGS